MTSNGKEDYYKYFSPTLNNNYDFSAPAHYTGSVAFLIGQTGMITTDVEYMNYGKSRLKSNLYSFEDVNNEIKDALGHTFNLRFGTEWRMRQFFVRGGTAYYGSPYGFGNSENSIKKLSAGIGYATMGGIYWDFAYELSESKSTFTPYSYYIDGENIVGPVTQHRWRNKLVATMKIKL